MSVIHMLKTAAGAMIPASEEDADALKRFKIGVVVRFEAKQMRNYEFFLKWWSLVMFAFDVWSETTEMPKYKGETVQPAKDRFRKDITIMAGYCHPVADINGGVHLEADSIAWGNMTEDIFEALFSATINVVLQKILAGKGYTETQLRELSQRTLDYA